MPEPTKTVQKSATKAVTATKAATGSSAVTPEPVDGDIQLEREMDRLSLEQAVRDFEIANARVIDLTQRLIAANQRIVELPGDERRLGNDTHRGAEPLRRGGRLARLPDGTEVGGTPKSLAEVGMTKARLLLAITVYNGRTVVPACLRSAAALRPTKADMDVLVLDDCSPDPGFSGEIRALCGTLGFQYYRSPRNLGIPRNVNLGLMRARDANYDFVIIANSDVLFAANLPDTLIETAATDPTIGSVTAWSNNVSIFSLPNEDPDLYLRRSGSSELAVRDHLRQFRCGGSRTHPRASRSAY